jgi:RNA polymerase sigma-70 factor (ECF subfamily)
MYRLAYRLTGNAEDAQDVVQETFLRAYRHRERYDSRGQVSTWLYRIAANYATDLLRRRRRWRTRDLDALETRSPMTSSEPPADRVAMGSDVGRGVARALETLTAKERIAFTLRHYEERSIKEIASIMGIRENATKNHVFRAVRKMRKALAPFVEPTR